MQNHIGAVITKAIHLHNESSYYVRFIDHLLIDQNKYDKEQLQQQ